jgi:hypothetical protein
MPGASAIVVCVKRHDQGADCGGNAGGDEYGALVHSGLAENDGIDEHDVHHREKSRHAGDEFGADVGALLGEPEISLKHGGELRLGFPRCRCPPWLFDHVDTCCGS